MSRASRTPIVENITKKEFALHLYRSAAPRLKRGIQLPKHIPSGIRYYGRGCAGFDGERAPHQNCVCCILLFGQTTSAMVEVLLLVTVHILGDRLLFDMGPRISRHRDIHVATIPNGLLGRWKRIDNECYLLHNGCITNHV